MVNLITSDAVTKNMYILQQAGQYKTTVQKKTVPADKVETKQNEKGKSQRYLLPFGLISGGALLIYYGVKRPNSVKFLKNLVCERTDKMQSEAVEFYSQAKKIAAEEFSATTSHIYTYKQNRYLDISPSIDKITSSEHVSEFAQNYNAAFDNIHAETAKDLRGGASDLDIYKGILYNVRNKAGDRIDQIRNKLNLTFSDYTYIPPFKNGGRKELITAFEKEMTHNVDMEKTAMWSFRNRIMDLEFSEKAGEMANVIAKARELIKKAKTSVIDASFEKIKQLLSLPEDFAPVYSKIFTADNFNNLSAEELKPVKFNKELNKIFEQSPLKQVLELKNFAELDEKALNEVFYKLSQHSSVEDIGILIDRVRLQNILDKASGTDNESMYRVVIAKLEFLLDKLNKIGKQEVVKRCNADFENLNEEQIRAKFYYLHDAAMRLGLDSYQKIHTYLCKNYPQYPQTSLYRNIKLTSERPDLYFF